MIARHDIDQNYVKKLKKDCITAILLSCLNTLLDTLIQRFVH